MDKAGNSFRATPKPGDYPFDSSFDEPWASENFDWSVVLPTGAGLLLGLIVDVAWPEAFGLWTLMLALFGLVVGEAYSVLHGGSVYRK